jgi:hypothetical protein
MFDIGALDTIIAIVIVLLVLSLIVQSIQSVLKKLLKMKSRVVFDSMSDLFKYIDTKALVGKTPKELVAEVTAQFEALGRVSLILKKPMLDSIAKGDLQKILAKLTNSDQLKAEVENWFDTVMQSFDERYARHMKTVALIVSFLVVIFLNANFFNLYRSIAGSDTLRAAIVTQGPAILKQAEAANAANKAAQSQQTKSTPTPTPTPTPLPANTGAPPTTGNTTPTQPAANPAPGSNEAAAAATKSKQELAEGIKELKGLVDQAEGLGLKPLTPKQVNDFVWGSGVWAGHPLSERFLHGIKVLLGLAIMALLLSVGAPFWQDTLESLFGIKNLLRKKSDTKNVEDDKGGQQKSD